MCLVFRSAFSLHVCNTSMLLPNTISQCGKKAKIFKNDFDKNHQNSWNNPERATIFEKVFYPEYADVCHVDDLFRDLKSPSYGFLLVQNHVFNEKNIFGKLLTATLFLRTPCPLFTV